jgi:hypothetical protein
LPHCGHRLDGCLSSQVGAGHSSSQVDRPKQGHETCARCCSTDTPPASLANVSRSRPTTGRHACFVMVSRVVRKRPPPPLAPAHFPTPHAPGARGDFLDGSTRFRAEGGTGRRHKNPGPQGASRKGTRVACGTLSPRRTARRTNYARPIRLSVGQKWPRIGILQESRNWDITPLKVFGRQRSARVPNRR